MADDSWWTTARDDRPTGADGGLQESQRIQGRGDAGETEDRGEPEGRKEPALAVGEKRQSAVEGLGVRGVGRATTDQRIPMG